MHKKIEKILIKVINEKFNLDLKELKLGVPPKNMFGDFSFN